MGRAVKHRRGPRRPPPSLPQERIAPAKPALGPSCSDRLLGRSFVLRGGTAAAVLYAGVLLVCYAPVVFGGKSLQAPLYASSGVAPGTGVSNRGTVNTFDVDLATPAFYEWPIDRYIGDTLRRGELPLWNPHQGAGAPLVVNYSTRVFFPFQMLQNVSPFVLWDFYFLLRLWIAGWLTYCFLARAGLGWTAAAVGGLLYMLSGAFTWFINLEQFVNPAMLVPMWFLAVEAFVERLDARRAAFGAVAEYRANRVALDVDTDCPGLVVLTNTFYLGCRAWADGGPGEIHRVNGVVGVSSSIGVVTASR